MSDAQRAKLNQTILDELNKALVIDHNLLPALVDRAEVYFEPKQFEQAMPDYNKILALDPTKAAAYNDRGLARMQLGDIYAAISDFSEAIQRKKRQLQDSASQENRADAYMKTRQWELAIRDLTAAISLNTGGVSLLMNIDQFRALYPEYKAASDESVTRKLNETFFPNLKYEDYAKGFLHDNVARGFETSTVIPEIYLKRSDAYLRAGNWHRAAVEFRRAINGFPEYAKVVDRWRAIDSQEKTHTYIDMKTLDDSHTDSIKLWIKQARGAPDTASPYSLQQYELNCARQIRTLSFANYDASGNLGGSREGGKWESVIPETLGETLLNGICRSD